MNVLGQFWDFLSANVGPGIILTALLLYVFIFVLSLLFQSPKPGPNPFKKNAAVPPKPFISDSSARDKVIKQGFNVKKIPEELDAIVIGSGVGGLAVANVMARVGKKVLVLEQHDQAGGCCHTYVEKGFEFDVGIHYIGEMRNNTISRLLVNQLTEGQLQWVDLDDEHDIVALGEPGKHRQFSYMAGRAEWKKAMLEKFPDEEKALDRYLQLLQEVRVHLMGALMLKTMPHFLAKVLVKTGLIHFMTKYFKYSQRSTWEVLEEITENKDLRAVLAYSFGDYGTLPKDSSFAMHATLINHYLYGSSYPNGGASEFALHMIPPIERAGGRVLVRAPVSQILIDDSGKAMGVRVQRSSGDIDIHAPLVISDAGVVNTFKNLLPKQVAIKSGLHHLLTNSSGVQSGVGCMSLFVGLKGTKEELQLKAQNMWAFTGNDVNDITETYMAKSAEEVVNSEVPLLFISFPSAKDPTFKDRYPGKSTCAVITFANWEWFSQWEKERVMKRGEEYDQLKDRIAHQMWEQTLMYYPHLKDKVEYFEVGTPVTNNYYIASPKGEIYGLDHSKERFSSPEVVMNLRPETGIPGLLLTGQDIFNCGFMGAIMGGVLCAGKVLNRNLWDDLVALKKDINKTK